MRKILLLITLFYSNSSLSQLTLISGGASPITNGSVFTAALPTAAPYSSYNWGLIYDAGTQVYSIDNPQTGFQGSIGFDYVIFRFNNYWKIVRFHLAPNVIQEYYETVAQYNSFDPPCNALWKEMTNADQVYPPGDFSIPYGGIVNLNFNGTNCIIGGNPSFRSVTTQSEGIQFAPQGSNILNSLSNVQVGFLAYDATSNSPVWYDGNSWNRIATSSAGPINMPLKNISSSYSILDDDYSIVYNGSGFHTISLPGSVYHIGRTISIINISSSSSVNISPSITNFGSNIAAGSQVLLISNGNYWLKMN